MANKPISMSKVRQVLKLYAQKIGKRKIGLRLGMSKNTVRHYIEAFHGMKTTIEELSKLSDAELNKRFHPPQQAIVNDKLAELHAFFPEMQKQLRKRGMTIAKQYRAFAKAHPDTYKETAFYKYYRLWCKRVNPSMHIEHIAGDKLYVDYAGGTLPYVDTDTGEVKEAQVFVAILGWSQFAFVEAMQNQTVPEFIAGCEHAMQYCGGVPLALVPDNLKSAVFKAHKYEPILNENFRSFAAHYGCTILPARARKPQDKAHVENMVKIVYQNIYTVMPQGELLSLSQLNQAIRKQLAMLNAQLLTDKNCSRRDLLAMEQSALHPLPDTVYEIRKIKQVTVMKNYHVLLTEDHHYYSVPYELIGKKLSMQYTRSVVELYLNYELVATHQRVRSPHNYTTEPAHMPATHQFVHEWSPGFFLEKARAIDPVVEEYIGHVLAKKQHPEQAYKSCQGILSFAKRVGHQRLINACKRGLDIGYYNYRLIDDILKKNMDAYEDEQPTEHMPSHENIRGGNYYQ